MAINLPLERALITARRVPIPEHPRSYGKAMHFFVRPLKGISYLLLVNMETEDPNIALLVLGVLNGYAERTVGTERHQAALVETLLGRQTEVLEELLAFIDFDDVRGLSGRPTQ